MCKTKTIKVNRRYRKLVYSSYFIPEIRLSGKWLEEIGINIGDLVSINIEENKLSITKQS